MSRQDQATTRQKAGATDARNPGSLRIHRDGEQLDDFTHFLATLSARFLSLPGERVAVEVHAALKQVGEYFDLDRVTVGEFTNDDESIMAMYTWSPAGIRPVPMRGRMQSRNVCDALRRGEVVAIPDTTAIPDGWDTEREEWTRSGAKAHLSIPFSIGEKRIGILSVSMVRRIRSWPCSVLERLTLVGQVFAHGVYRRETERGLRTALAQVEDLRDRLQAENQYLRKEISSENDGEGMVGRSAALLGVLSVAEQVAPTDVTVLIQGETGTGKDLVARAIHARSTRSERPLIKVNCSAIPDALAESELFGHEKGAFTGAVNRQMGRFELADNGTIFLDEIADMSIEVQSKLLRVLQDGEFERLGSGELRSVNVRVIAATSRNLTEAMEEGRFRSDLYYRLRVVPIEMPALRERREDIPLLVWHFVQQASAKHRKAIRDIPCDTMNALVRYDWPGNVRELENIIERSVVLSVGQVLELRDSLIGRGHAAASVLANDAADLAAVERAHITSVLRSCNWKVKGPGNAAERLGLHPSTLRGRIKKLGLTRRE